jgi:hypothetical protein
MEPDRSKLYGLMAEFDDPNALVAAAGRAHSAGYRRLDAYTPFPIEELGEALGVQRTAVPLLVLIGGIAGAIAGFGLAYYTSVISYPLNIGGRPLNSWPAFIIPTFETTILFAAATAVFGMLALNGLPQLYHPVFNAPRFRMATRDRFFLCVEARDPKFNLDETRRFLEGLGAREVSDVES